MARRKKVWLYKPPRQPKPRVPESTKSEVEKRCNLSYMRHTGQWWEIFRELSLNECIEAINDMPHFTP
jgi:hypothetical protein